MFGSLCADLCRQVFGVFSMKCIAYDAVWLAGLVEDYPTWEEERKAQLAANAVKKTKKATRKTSSRTANKETSQRKAGAGGGSGVVPKSGSKRRANDFESESSSEDEQHDAGGNTSGSESEVRLLEEAPLRRSIRIRATRPRHVVDGTNAVDVIEVD